MDNKKLEELLATANGEQRKVIRAVLEEYYAKHFHDLFNRLKPIEKKRRTGDGLKMKLTPYTYKTKKPE